MAGQPWRGPESIWDEAVLKIDYSTRIKHVGEKQVSEKTDSEYVQKTLSKLAEDYRNCPKEWRDVFLTGLQSYQIKALEEMGVLK